MELLPEFYTIWPEVNKLSFTMENKSISKEADCFVISYL